jgi:hypothetical protein
MQKDAQHASQVTLPKLQKLRPIFHLFPTFSEMANQPDQEELNYPEHRKKGPLKLPV